MKDLDIQTTKDKLEVSVQQKKQIEHRLEGKIKPHENHKIWEINNETLEISLAVYTQVTAVHFGQTKFKKEIIKKPGYSYVSALKKETALKKALKGDNGSKKFSISEYGLR